MCNVNIEPILFLLAITLLSQYLSHITWILNNNVLVFMMQISAIYNLGKNYFRHPTWNILTRTIIPNAYMCKYVATHISGHTYKHVHIKNIRVNIRINLLSRSMPRRLETQSQTKEPSKYEHRGNKPKPMLWCSILSNIYICACVQITSVKVSYVNLVIIMYIMYIYHVVRGYVATFIIYAHKVYNTPSRR